MTPDQWGHAPAGQPPAGPADGQGWAGDVPAAAPGQRRDPTLTVLASFFLPGLGTILAGHTARGFGIMGLWALGLVGAILCGLVGLFVSSVAILLVVPALGVALVAWIWGLVDAYQRTREHNARHGLP